MFEIEGGATAVAAHVGEAAAKARCLETRRDGALTMRRYRKPNGRTVKTMELPWTLWLRVRTSAMASMPGYLKAEAARDRIALIETMLREGDKSEWISAITGVTPQRVRQIKSRMKK